MQQEQRTKRENEGLAKIITNEITNNNNSHGGANSSYGGGSDGGTRKRTNDTRPPPPPPVLRRAPPGSQVQAIGNIEAENRRAMAQHHRQMDAYYGL